MSNQTAPRLRQTFLFAQGNPADDVLDALFSRILAEYHDAIRDALDAGVDGCFLVELIPSGLGLASLRCTTDDVCCELVELDDMQLFAALSERLVGVRREVVHDLCNDLSAARLNGELALHLLERDDGKAGPQVVSALQSLVRATVSVEAGLRDLELNVGFDLRRSEE